MADTLQVACWVLGDDPCSPFVVNIDKSMYVDNLKEAIKARKPALAIGYLGICSEWHGFENPVRPVRVTGRGTRGYGYGYRIKYPCTRQIPLMP
jgi:hypothetical protein